MAPRTRAEERREKELKEKELKEKELKEKGKEKESELEAVAEGSGEAMEVVDAKKDAAADKKGKEKEKEKEKVPEKAKAKAKPQPKGKAQAKGKGKEKANEEEDMADADGHEFDAFEEEMEDLEYLEEMEEDSDSDLFGQRGRRRGRSTSKAKAKSKAKSKNAEKEEEEEEEEEKELKELTRRPLEFPKGTTPAALGQRLWLACSKGKLAEVEEILQNEKVDVNFSDTKTGSNALHVACQGGHTAIVEKLLQRKVPVNELNQNGMTPLHVACFYCNPEVVALLLKCPEIQVDTNNHKDYLSPFKLACMQGDLDCVELLLEDERIDPHHFTRSIHSAVYQACSHGHADVVQLLLKHPRFNTHIPVRRVKQLGREPKGKGKGKAALAAAKLEASKLAVPLSLRADLGKRCLDIAATRGHLGVIRVLVDDLRLQFEFDRFQSPLALAASHGFAHVVTFLLRSRLEFNAQHILSALDAACREGCLDALEVLLREPVEFPDSNHAPLHVAIARSHTRAVERLLRDPRTTFKHNPLEASCQANVEIFNLIFDDPRSDDPVMRSGALSRAPVFGNPSVILRLLEDKRVQIRPGCLRTAAQVGNLEVLEVLLQDERTDVNAVDLDQDSALIISVYNSRVDVVKRLLRCPGINVNARKPNGRTALMMALEKRLEEVAQLLLDAGANCNQASNDHGTALQLCIRTTPSCFEKVLRRSDIVDQTSLALCLNEPHDPNMVEMLLASHLDFTPLNPVQIYKHQNKLIFQNFMKAPAKEKQRLRVKHGLAEKLANEIFAVSVFVSDGFLQYQTHEEPPALKIQNWERLVRISSSLPIELQMVFCNRISGLARDLIPLNQREAALQQVAKTF